jgi:threonine/homoserine/homoserine lactone efflux protein
VAWLNFLAYAVITAATPGPNNLMSMSNAGRLGFRKGMPFNLGVLAGFVIVMAACTLLCSLLSSVIPQIERPMRFAGAAYMLFLAWKTFKSTDGVGEAGGAKGFWSGFLLQFVNPKIYVYGFVSMEAYVLPHFAGNPPVLAAFAVVLSMIGFTFTLCWAGFGAAFRLIFSKYAKVTNVVMALLLVYCAASLLF